MANRLPGFQDLGPLRTPTVTTAVPDIRGAGSGAAAAREIVKARTRGLELAEKGLKELDVRIDKRDLAAAETDLYEGSLEVEASVDDVEDHKQWDKHVKDGMAKVSERAASRIQNPDLKAQFQAKSAQVGARLGANTHTKAVRREHEVRAADMFKQLDTRLKTALTTTDNEQRMDILQGTLELIDAHARAGDITPREQLLAKNKFSTDFAEGWVDLLEPGEAVKLFEAGFKKKGPKGARIWTDQNNPLDFLEPGTRAKLFDQAKDKLKRQDFEIRVESAISSIVALDDNGLPITDEGVARKGVSKVEEDIRAAVRRRIEQMYDEKLSVVTEGLAQKAQGENQAAETMFAQVVGGKNPYTFSTQEQARIRPEQWNALVVRHKQMRDNAFVKPSAASFKAYGEIMDLTVQQIKDGGWTGHEIRSTYVGRMTPGDLDKAAAYGTRVHSAEGKELESLQIKAASGSQVRTSIRTFINPGGLDADHDAEIIQNLTFLMETWSEGFIDREGRIPNASERNSEIASNLLSGAILKGGTYYGDRDALQLQAPRDRVFVVDVENLNENQASLLEQATGIPRDLLGRTVAHLRAEAKKRDITLDITEGVLDEYYKSRLDKSGIFRPPPETKDDKIKPGVTRTRQSLVVPPEIKVDKPKPKPPKVPTRMEALRRGRGK
jgi:hypothetical protein